MDLRFGVKIYDNDWFLRHRLSAEQTADLLAEWGATYVIAQSKFLPMPNSAVTSSVAAEDRLAYEALDDVAFRKLLADRGIAYFACLNICFDPDFSDANPGLLGTDQWGARVRSRIGMSACRRIAKKTSPTRSGCSKGRCGFAAGRGPPRLHPLARLLGNLA